MWGRVGRKPDAFYPTPQGPHGCDTNAPIPLRWGSKKTIYLSDGKGQNNNIAIFDTWVQGLCAQLDLWRTSANYRNKRFRDAIAVWSGHNEVESYIAFVLKRVPGMTRDTVMDDAFWRGPMAIPFLKAQAWHEAGKPYPAPDADWVEAHRIVLKGAVVKTIAKDAGKVAVPAVVSGWAWPDLIPWIVVAAVVAVIGFAAYRYFIRRDA